MFGNLYYGGRTEELQVFAALQQAKSICFPLGVPVLDLDIPQQDLGPQKEKKMDHLKTRE